MNNNTVQKTNRKKSGRKGKRNIVGKMDDDLSQVKNKNCSAI